MSRRFELKVAVKIYRSREKRNGARKELVLSVLDTREYRIAAVDSTR